MQRMYRLSRGRDLERLLRRGRRVLSSLFEVIVQKNKGLHARFAFIVPKRVAKRAVIRNKLRRRMREWVRRDQSALSAPYDVAVVCRSGAPAATRAKFYEEFTRLLAEFKKNHP